MEIYFTVPGEPVPQGRPKFTTNLAGKEIATAYGQRITSRIFKNSEGCAFKFTKTDDKRLKGV